MATQPVRKSSITLLLLCGCLGAILAGYLSYLYYASQVGNFIKAPACGSGGLLDCHLVSLSKYATVAGRPVAIWGVALYATWIVLAVAGRWGEPPHRVAAVRLIGATALLAIVVDITLAWVMIFQVRAICIWCVATYAVNGLALLIAWKALQSSGEHVRHVWRDLWMVCPWMSRGSAAIPVLTVAWCLTALAGLWGVTELTTRFTQGNAEEMRQQVKQFLDQQQPSTVDTKDAPAKGRADAPITIVEFSDFLCPVCRRAATTAKAVMNNHHRDVRFVFKQYPLDRSCNTALNRNIHPGACRVAMGTICAHQQGQFWALHDRIFAREPTYDVKQLENDAEAVGLDMPRWGACLEDGATRALLARDIEQARQLDVRSTPTFVINGYVFRGAMAPAMFETIITMLLERTTTQRNTP